ncbi:visual pigment-like receptor peropsin [Mytilus edulis]|uniref:visual pigment-like receptor peropsin n=1 Tax=Mytilus edulis TaxID=6550 RepID=UPI0039EED837
MNAIFYCIAFVMFLVTFIGCSVNGAIVYVVLVNKHLQNVNNTFVVSMCIDGFLISSVGTIFTAATSVRGEWIFGDSVCQLHSFIVFFLGLAIIATLTSMAVEKYIVIKKESRNIVTKRVCLYILFGCHLYGLAIALMPFLGWNQYQLEGCNITCSLKMDGNDENSTSFNIFMLIVGLVLPLAIMITVYSKTIIKMKEKHRSMNFNTYSSHRKTILKREMAVTKTILLMIGVFSLAWSPYAIHCIVSMIGWTKGMSPFVATIPALIAKSSVIYHPCIYISKNRAVKNALVLHFNCFKKSNRYPKVVNSLPLNVCGMPSPLHKNIKATDIVTVDEDVDFSNTPSTSTDTHERLCKFLLKDNKKCSV